MNRTDLSIVIPSYNTSKLLANCIRSINKAEKGTYKIETIVIDNSSTDDSINVIQTKFPRVKLIKNKKNLGFAKASNQGWKAARGKYILFLNSDTEIGRNDFTNLLSWLVQNDNIKKRIGAVSGKLTLRSGKSDPDCHRGFPTPWSSLTFFLGLEKLFPKSKLFAQYHQGWKDMNEIHQIDSGCGAFLVVKKDVLTKLKGFDEDYFFYGEDIDLCYRIKTLGLPIYYYPHISALHYKGASSGLRSETKDITRPSRDSLMKVTEGSIDAWKRFYYKFYSNKYPALVTYFVIFGISIKGFIRKSVNYIGGK